MLPSYDHVPLSAVFDFITTPAVIDTSTCPNNKVNFIWAKATDKDLLGYKYNLLVYNLVYILVSNLLVCILMILMLLMLLNAMMLTVGPISI